MADEPKFGGGPTAQASSGTWSQGRATDGVPAPGELAIKERRSWRTWQLAVAAFASGLVCMFIGNMTAGGSTPSASSGGKSAYTLPPAASSSSTSTSNSATSTTSASAAASTTTSLPPSASATTSTTTSGPVTVLLGPYQSHGNWTSTPFTIGGGTWNIGWAFQCTPAPAAGPAFQVFVVRNGASPTGSAAVSESGGSGQSVTAQTTAGSQQLVVEAGANCVWAVKVTGVA